VKGEKKTISTTNLQKGGQLKGGRGHSKRKHKKKKSPKKGDDHTELRSADSLRREYQRAIRRGLQIIFGHKRSAEEEKGSRSGTKEGGEVGRGGVKKEKDPQDMGSRIGVHCRKEKKERPERKNS